MARLHSYSHPPVVETATAVQFRPIKGLRNVQLWEFWSIIRDAYPLTEDQEPLDQKTELFGDEIQKGPRLPTLRFKPHASRLQALTEDRHRMVQIQNGRFIFNWRGLGGDEYPRWDDTYAEFSARYDDFIRFIAGQGLPEVAPNQWEVTYVNHMLKGQDWELETDWPELLPGMVGACDKVSAGNLETIDSRVQYVLDNDAGRLYIDLKKAVLAEEPDQELLVLTLTARGGVPASGRIEEGLLLGHDSIVNSFTEITGESAHERWGYVR